MLALARALRPRAAAAAARPAACAWARPFSTGEEPSTPAVSGEEALAFARERKQHRAVLGYLRRAWAAEQEAKRHAAQDQATAERYAWETERSGGRGAASVGGVDGALGSAGGEQGRELERERKWVWRTQGRVRGLSSRGVSLGAGGPDGWRRDAIGGSGCP